MTKQSKQRAKYITTRERLKVLATAVLAERGAELRRKARRDRVVLGELMRLVREAKGMSRPDLAKQWHYTVDTMQVWERGETPESSSKRQMVLEFVDAYFEELATVAGNTG